MQLQIGERLVSEYAEWEVAGRPFTTAGGKTAHARVEKVKQPDVTEIRSWGAHERVAVKRTEDACWRLQQSTRWLGSTRRRGRRDMILTDLLSSGPLLALRAILFKKYSSSA